jgi:PAS domain-containing protein
LEWGWIAKIGALGVIALGFGKFLRDQERRFRADTEREKTLCESEMRFQKFAKSASDWLWEMDKDFKFTYFSNVDAQPHLLNLIGKTRWEIAGVDPETDEYWGQHKQVLEAHEPYRDLAIRYRASDSDLRHVVAAGWPIFDEDGSFQGYRGTAYDGTE